MAYTETTARQQVAEAGRRLLETGLIARTWGNLSARISDTQFVITPSGLAYDTLRAEDLVLVNIAACTSAGPGKPSSEKDIHADAYRLRPQVDFVIHTHQTNATIAGLTGQSLPVDEDLRSILGHIVPCAAYGLSSTKRLRRFVADAVAQHCNSASVLLRSHGALCLGGDCEAAFAVATALETQCGRTIAANVSAAEKKTVLDWGHSLRREDGFLLTLDRETTFYPLDDCNESWPEAAILHASVYHRYDVTCIRHETAPDVVAVSSWGKSLPPLLDDLVQIAGVHIRCVEADASTVVGGLRGRNAVLLQGAGALYTAQTAADIGAVGALLRKGCAAARYAAAVPGCQTLGRLDASIQRIIYLNKYAKQLK